MDANEIWTLEERLWVEGPRAYRELLDPACLMAFPGMGIMRSPAIMESIEQAPRWQSVAMKDRHLEQPADDIVVIGYRASAERADADRYHCFCTSTYRRTQDGWSLVQHQQTMAE